MLVIAVGLPWFGGGFSADGFDIPLAVLFSNTAQGGIPVGVVFLLAGAAGLGVALLNPAKQPLTMTFIIVGAASAFFTLWYMIRIMSNLQGAPLFSALSIGFWLAFLASIGALVGGVMLKTGAGVRQPA